MVVFKHATWENRFDLDAQKLSVLVVENPALLWKYCIELLSQSNGQAGEFCILKDFVEQPFDKLCNIETSIANLSLNTKKLQTALVKRCVELSTSPEFELNLRRTSAQLYEFCKLVCQDVGYSVELNEDIDTAGLFKLFSLSLKESFDSLLEKLIEYVNVNAEFLRIKNYVFLFLTKFLSYEDLCKFFEHCRYQGISIILIEESFPNFFESGDIHYQGLIIDLDGVEITKKLLNS